jgi:hypothetical protein
VNFAFGGATHGGELRDLLACVAPALSPGFAGVAVALNGRDFMSDGLVFEYGARAACAPLCHLPRRALSAACALPVTVELAVRAVWPAAASANGGTLLTVTPATTVTPAHSLPHLWTESPAGAAQVFGGGFRQGVTCALSRAFELTTMTTPSAAAHAMSVFVSSSIIRCEAPAQAGGNVASVAVQLDTAVPLASSGTDSAAAVHASGGAGGSNAVKLRFAGACCRRHSSASGC